jgi:hypothetical protein
MMILKKMRFFWQNWFDSAVVTANSEVADYPVTMLQNRWKAADCGWRSAGADTGGVEIVENLLDPRAVEAFILENMNLTAGAFVELGGHASDPTGEEHTSYELPITITAAMIAAKRIEITLPAAETYQWWRLLISDPGNPDGYLSASRIYLGPIFEPEGECRGNSNHWPESDSEVSYASGGQASVTERPLYEVYDVPISIIGQSDAIGYSAINTECGKKLPLWICLDTTDEIASTIYAHFLEYIAFPMTVSGALWEPSLKFREEL